jgi:signal transduction histidine kinase
MSVLDNWGQWKDFLGSRLDQAQSEGMNNNVISDVAFQVGDYLAKNVDPKNEQERVLADLWSVADEKEQHAIANLMVKLVQNNG